MRRRASSPEICTVECCGSNRSPVVTGTAKRGCGLKSSLNFESSLVAKKVPEESNSVTTVVSDDSDATSITLSASSSSITEGGSITYTATLSSPVTGSPLDITLSNGQHIVIGVGSVVAMLAIGETIDDAEIYRGFFDKLAQSAFLTGHDI